MPHAVSGVPRGRAGRRPRPARRLRHRQDRGALASEGLPLDCLDRLEQDSVQVAKTASRSVLGFMNEMAFYLDYAVADTGGLSDCESDVLGRDLRRRLYSRDGYATRSSWSRDDLPRREGAQITCRAYCEV